MNPEIRIRRHPLADVTNGPCTDCWSVERRRPIFGWRHVTNFYADPDMLEHDVVEMALHHAWPFPPADFKHPRASTPKFNPANIEDALL